MTAEIIDVFAKKDQKKFPKFFQKKGLLELNFFDVYLRQGFLFKLRKREEHSNSVHPIPEATTTVVLQTTTVQSSINNNNNCTTTNSCSNPVTSETTTDPLAYRGQFLWNFPPPPAQRIMYNNEQKNIVQNTNNDHPGFVRGFRKNLGGKWRRLVKKKAATEVYKIPAELKPQLKQIYVY